MPKKLGVVMDPIDSIHPEKDTSLAMMLAAQARGYEVHYMLQADIWVRDGEVWANSKRVEVFDDSTKWYDIKSQHIGELAEFDVILMRKDPPFDTEYIYTTYLLEFAQARGTLVVNKPQSLRDANEKLFSSWFPSVTPPQLVTRDADLLRAFIKEHDDVVLKPLHGMGGGSIFKLNQKSPNINVVIELLTRDGNAYIMAQKFIPEITTGDKRIILLNGEPVPYGLLRIPKDGEIRGNLAAGGKGLAVEITARDREICEVIGPTLREKGLIFVGIDVIGDYLTEINVTSPTCAREIDQAFGINIADQFLEIVEASIT